MDVDAFGQKRVSKALFQYKMHVQAGYRCARRSRAACRSYWMKERQTNRTLLSAPPEAVLATTGGKSIGVR